MLRVRTRTRKLTLRRTPHRNTRPVPPRPRARACGPPCPQSPAQLILRHFNAGLCSSTSCARRARSAPALASTTSFMRWVPSWLGFRRESGQCSSCAVAVKHERHLPRIEALRAHALMCAAKLRDRSSCKGRAPWRLLRCCWSSTVGKGWATAFMQATPFRRLPKLTLTCMAGLQEGTYKCAGCGTPLYK